MPPTPSLQGISIDSLFDWLKRTQAAAPYRLEVTYDSTYGFPTSIFVDRNQNVADDEETISVTIFTLLPPVTLRITGNDRMGRSAGFSVGTGDRQRMSGPGLVFTQGRWTFDLNGRIPSPSLQTQFNGLANPFHQRNE